MYGLFVFRFIFFRFGKKGDFRVFVNDWRNKGIVNGVYWVRKYLGFLWILEVFLVVIFFREIRGNSYGYRNIMSSRVYDLVVGSV